MPPPQRHAVVLTRLDWNSGRKVVVCDVRLAQEDCRVKQMIAMKRDVKLVVCSLTYGPNTIGSRKHVHSWASLHLIMVHLKLNHYTVKHFLFHRARFAHAAE